MKATNAITFRHPYYKLDTGRKGEPFTTIRGKAQFKRRKVGQLVPVETPAGNFPAFITALEVKCVCQMPLAFLKADAEYPGCTITTHQQFVNLLNSFRAPMWTQVTLESELTIITLKRNLEPNRCLKIEAVYPGHCNCEACIQERRPEPCQKCGEDLQTNRAPEAAGNFTNLCGLCADDIRNGK